MTSWKFSSLFLAVAVIITARSELRKVLFLAPFVYEISRTAVRIRAKFTRKTCLEVEGQGHHGENGIFRSFRPPACGLCLVKHLWPLVFLNLFVHFILLRTVR